MSSCDIETHMMFSCYLSTHNENALLVDAGPVVISHGITHIGIKLCIWECISNGLFVTYRSCRVRVRLRFTIYDNGYSTTVCSTYESFNTWTCKIDILFVRN